MVERARRSVPSRSRSTGPAGTGAARPRRPRSRSWRPTGRGTRRSRRWPASRRVRRGGELDVVERLPGIGMTDYYGLSGVPAGPEHDQMTEAECERKIALLRASWATLDDVASRVSPELRKGPRGGGRERDEIVRHVIGSEIYESARRSASRSPLETREDPDALRTYRDAFVRGIRDYNARGVMAADVDRPVPHPPLRVAHARPRVGDGGPGPDPELTTIDSAPLPDRGPRAPTRDPSRVVPSGGSGTGSATSGRLPSAFQARIASRYASRCVARPSGVMTTSRGVRTSTLRDICSGSLMYTWRTICSRRAATARTRRQQLADDPATTSSKYAQQARGASAGAPARPTAAPRPRSARARGRCPRSPWSSIPGRARRPRRRRCARTRAQAGPLGDARVPGAVGRKALDRGLLARAPPVEARPVHRARDDPPLLADLEDHPHRVRHALPTRPSGSPERVLLHDLAVTQGPQVAAADLDAFTVGRRPG